MIRDLPEMDSLPIELRELVKWSVELLGGVIKREVGEQLFHAIETLRINMTRLRESDDLIVKRVLQEQLVQLRQMNSKERMIVARSFTLMLELMNGCENAYRSCRLAQHARLKHLNLSKEGGVESKLNIETIIYVLTAHPTEARSPQNILVFHSIQRTLMDALNGDFLKVSLENKLRHDLELAWRISIVRERTPHVKDEAEHIYSLLLANATLTSLLDASREVVPVYVRSWVGGDKDGHPAVDEKVMRESLMISRAHLIRFAKSCLMGVGESLSLLPSLSIKSDLSELSHKFILLREIRSRDGARVMKVRKKLRRVMSKYETQIGVIHPLLIRLKQLFHVFPGLVVPLELRESSDILMSNPKERSKLAIDRMLDLISQIAQGGDPRWYTRGFIVSMANSIEHLRAAHTKVHKVFGCARIPVIPLFEQMESLDGAAEIVLQMIQDPLIGKDISENWGGSLEVMLGYSDSAKESGVFPSRLAIAQAMNRIDLICKYENAEKVEKVKPVFFQGSGGSVDRGGGSVQDQTAWWPASALQIYKVTIQGEMVERSLSTPEITRGQIERIAASANHSLDRSSVTPHLSIVQEFSDRVSEKYRKIIEDSDFLKTVEKSTPYSYLNLLKIGSRPARRNTQLSVQSLRAIPWVLCWTQTRVLFPTWWGVGSTWKSFDHQSRMELREAFYKEPVFSSFVRALGFTLAKVELPIWKLYLSESGLARDLIIRIETLFDDEFQFTLEFIKFISEQDNLLWFRPWLGASIRLRAPMIHPLNLLQILAIEGQDSSLFRHTVTGIASGMLTTG